MTSERWLPVVGYEGSYEVSDLGRVRSLERRSTFDRLWPSVVLSPSSHPDGHLQVTLARRGSRRTRWVHRLVLESFVGPCPDGMEGLHRDGNPANNRLSNLGWGTRKANMRDQVRHGSHFYASKTACPHGHPYDENNTYNSPTGTHRKCRTCMRASAQRTNAKRRAKRAEEKVT